MDSEEVKSSAKTPIAPKEAKEQLLRWMGTGMIGRVREIFQTYDVPSEVLLDDDIQWSLGKWKANLQLATTIPIQYVEEEPMEATLQFLDSTFPISEKTRQFLENLGQPDED
ncbi:MAG TPA: hypothetical protein VI873_04940 [Candidatus Peribacteraceae bacterium]|nr:hypothetical protein [Candidatus Peribacteraceae bacterium]